MKWAGAVLVAALATCAATETRQAKLGEAIDRAQVLQDLEEAAFHQEACKKQKAAKVLAQSRLEELADDSSSTDGRAAAQALVSATLGLALCERNAWQTRWRQHVTSMLAEGWKCDPPLREHENERLVQRYVHCRPAKPVEK